MKPGGYFDTPEQARAFLKRLGLLKKQRMIEGAEREQVETMLRLLGPGAESNNQHVWCDEWVVGNITYQHITGDGVDELLEITEEEDDVEQNKNKESTE